VISASDITDERTGPFAGCGQDGAGPEPRRFGPTSVIRSHIQQLPNLEENIIVR
jgi:hypothetical protein